MKYLKILVALITLWSFAISLKSQTESTSNSEVHYKYDLEGNCISRNVIMLKKNISSDHQKDKNPIFEDKETKIIIYPNPTKGLLKIEIPDYIQNENSFFSIYDLNGKLHKKIKVEGIETQLDLSNYKDGVYILQINRNGKNSSWKIIKVN